jgi:ABC-2 type transport system ATP-binding protein
MRFKPSAPISDQDLRALPSVTSLSRHGAQIEVEGGQDLIQQVTSLLAQRQIIAAQLRIEQSTLDDAFLALTADAQSSDYSSTNQRNGA